MMQVSVEDINSVKKTLHIEIPEAEVTSELDKAYNELKKKPRSKAFGPVKCPDRWWCGCLKRMSTRM